MVESDSAPLPKLRVLCLHSFRTSAEVMQMQLLRMLLTVYLRNIMFRIRAIHTLNLLRLLQNGREIK